jgi:hypothetical protein
MEKSPLYFILKFVDWLSYEFHKYSFPTPKKYYTVWYKTA